LRGFLEAELAERRMEEIKKQAEQKESENMEQRHITDVSSYCF